MRVGQDRSDYESNPDEATVLDDIRSQRTAAGCSTVAAVAEQAARLCPSEMDSFLVHDSYRWMDR